MSCLAVLIALITPRLLIVLLWLFTHWFEGIFHTWLLPVLGFIFLPTTLLWYTVVTNWFNGHWGPLQIAFMVVAVVIDLSPASSGKRRRK